MEGGQRVFLARGWNGLNIGQRRLSTLVVVLCWVVAEVGRGTLNMDGVDLYDEVRGY